MSHSALRIIVWGMEYGVFKILNNEGVEKNSVLMGG